MKKVFLVFTICLITSPAFSYISKSLDIGEGGNYKPQIDRQCSFVSCDSAIGYENNHIENLSVIKEEVMEAVLQDMNHSLKTNETYALFLIRKELKDRYPNIQESDVLEIYEASVKDLWFFSSVSRMDLIGGEGGN